MKNKKVTDEEKFILDSYENEEWESVPDVDRKKKEYQKMAKDSQKKTKVITIRISESDLLGLKSKARRQGMPYQTMISSELHKMAQ
jgi:predicted DNA binding CopG/RHH family protein